MALALQVFIYSFIYHNDIDLDIAFYRAMHFSAKRGIANPNMGHLVQREHPQNWGGIGVGSLGSAKKPPISPKRCKIGPRLLLRINRMSYYALSIGTKIKTLGDLERRIQGLHKVF